MDVPARKSKKVVIIGGGPAGLEAARICADRGHTVTLFEKEEVMGGKFRMACAAEFKAEMKQYLDWSIRTASEHENVTINLGTEASLEAVKAENPDAIIVAAGADPIKPPFTALGTDKLVWVGDAEDGTVPLGDHIAVCGGGVTGMEFALSMIRMGKKVTIVDLLPENELGAGGSPINLICLKDLLKEGGVEFICEARIEDIDEGGVHILKNGEKATVECDTAVLSLGFRPDAKLSAAFGEICDDVYVVGDAKKPGNVWNANTTAFDAAMMI